MNPVFNNREPNGTWRVRFTDSARLDVGIVSALSLTLTTAGVITPPTGVVPDSYIAGRSTPLVVAAPGVLGNDLNSAGSGALTATLQTSPAQGAVLLNSHGSFIYTPAQGYLGPDSFTYFASNDAPGSSASTAVSITVVPVQPPTQVPHRPCLRQPGDAALGSSGNRTGRDRLRAERHRVVHGQRGRGRQSQSKRRGAARNLCGEYHCPERVRRERADRRPDGGRTVARSTAHVPVDGAPSVTSPGRT